MADLYKLWTVSPQRPDIQQKLKEKLGVSTLIAQLLINRGLDDEASVRNFLYGSYESLGDPFQLKDMLKAVERIVKAIHTRQNITIYGDYDVDGITSSALLKRVLSQLGANVEYYIPDRQSEGYGLNSTALRLLKENGTDLLITVDCGINAVNEVAEIIDTMDVIITDHHEPPEVLPNAYSVINPKQKDCSYSDKNLAGVGVAFKLCQALWGFFQKPQELLYNYLDIVAIGTIADIVPLLGENRIIVKLGLRKLEESTNLGLNALIEACGLRDTKLDTGKVGFMIAPRLNAAGRVSHASVSVELLVTENGNEARNLAVMLNDENAARQAIEKDILMAVQARVEEYGYHNQHVIVVDGENWHTGVIGIVASRILEKYYRPVVIISTHEGVGKGSCRSIRGFNMFEGLKQCQDLLTQFGGHRQAAGLTICADKIDEFRKRLNMIAEKTLNERDYLQVVNVDSMLAIEEITAGFMEELASLAPYGMGNPSPVFACEKLTVNSSFVIGKDGKHLKLKISRKSDNADVVAWNMGGMAAVLNTGNCIDLAFFPEYNEWQGKRRVQLRAHDIKLSENAQLQVGSLTLVDVRNFDKHLYLNQVLHLYRRTVIYVDDTTEKENILARIKKDFSSQVNVSVLVMGDKGIEESIDNARHVIFYNMPYNWFDFCEIICEISQKSAATIHFLYNHSDINKAQNKLYYDAPDRELIAKIYITLKKWRKEQIPSIEMLVNEVNTQFELSLDEPACIKVIDILGELELVALQYDEKNAYSLVQLLPDPCTKLSLESSITYKDLQQVRAAFEEHLVKTLSLPSRVFLREFSQVLNEGNE